MRKHFDQEPFLGTKPISEVRIPTKSRDELAPVLMGLQHIFTTPELNRQVFEILEGKILVGKNNTGRPGMGLWEIFVLATVRNCLNANYDRLVRGKQKCTDLGKEKYTLLGRQKCTLC